MVYFPKRFPRNGNPEQTALRKKRIDTLLDVVIDDGRNYDETLFKVEKEILEHDKPNIWNIYHEENMERALEVDFQKFGIAVTNMTGQKLEETTTMTFFASVEHLEEKHKNNNGKRNN